MIDDVKENSPNGKTMAKDGISEMEKIIAQGTLDELTKIAENTKTMAERTEAGRAVAEASMAGGKANACHTSRAHRTSVVWRLPSIDSARACLWT